MRAKAIRDLSQLSDADFFEEVSAGLNLIIDHVTSIEADAKFLSEEKRRCGLNILEAVLQEEAAKFLILLDAARCDKAPADNFSKQLGRFNDHLAKGIYALAYSLRPANFQEIRRIVERECHKYYLDGPEGFDWIFRNEILQRREETIYVDYIESDGKHYWLSPERFYGEFSMPSLPYMSPQIVQVATALWNVGCAKPEALSIIAKIWRPIKMKNDFSWPNLRDLNIKTLKEWEDKELLNEQPEDVYRTIIDRWMFPLHSIDIRIIEVKRSVLEEEREKRFFSMYY